MQRRACIASRMLSSGVVSPRQTLRELARTTSNSKPSLSISGTAHARLLMRARHNAPRVCTSVLLVVGLLQTPVSGLSIKNTCCQPANTLSSSQSDCIGYAKDQEH